MRIVILGPPGAGKGTQAVEIAQARRITHISTGDVFRAASAGGTPMGLKAQEYMSAGKLVPDEVVIGVVEERLKQDDCTDGFMLDGFPRTLPQAEALDRILDAMGTRLDAVINIATPDEVCEKRLSGRRLCPQCKRGYHVLWMPPKEEGKCDDCRIDLIQRADDRPESIEERLRQYHQETAPLIDYYSGTGVLIDIPGDQGVEALAEGIELKLDAFASA